MSCFRMLLGIVGLAMLLIGLVALFLAVGPQLNTETRLLGGASTTQQTVAAQAFGAAYDEANLPDLPVSIDGEFATTNTLNTAPEISSSALTDVSTLELSEAEAANEVNVTQQETNSDLQSFQAVEPEAFSIASQSSNTAIDKSTAVELIPLQIAGSFTAGDSGQGGAGSVTGVEQRVVELEFPASLRVGGSGSVRITLKVLPSGQVEVVPEIEDNAILATPILLTDHYDTHTANFTARLAAPGLGVQESTPATQVLERGEEGTWRWSLKAPTNSGRFVITLGIDVLWLPKGGDAAIGPRPIWGQAVQVDANYVFGSITVPQASVAGSALAVIGFIIQIPLLGEILSGGWKLFFGRRTKKQTNQRR